MLLHAKSISLPQLEKTTVMTAQIYLTENQSGHPLAELFESFTPDFDL
jgi:hypothetical protein